MKIICTTIFLTIFLFTGILAQAKDQKQLKLFKLTAAKFQYKKNPWGNELFLHISGEAQKFLDGGLLILSVWYHGERVVWKRIPLKYIKYNEGKLMTVIGFSDYWGPLNESYQHILAGNYEVRLEFGLSHQPRKLQAKIKKWSRGKKIANASKTLYWRDPQYFREEEQKIKKFYHQRIYNIYAIYSNLNKAIAQGMAVSQDIQNKRTNPFLNPKSKKFDTAKWRLWLYSNFNNKLDQEKKIFQKFHTQLFSRRHPITKSALIQYYNLLARFAKASSTKVYKQNKQKADIRDTLKDGFGPKKTRDIEHNLRKMLTEITQDLEMDLNTITQNPH